LPAAAAERLVALLQSSHPVPHPALDEVRRALAPDAAGRFVHALFEQWRAHGADAAERWVIAALGWFPDDARNDDRLALATEWHAGGRTRRAGALLDAVAEQGTEAALLGLDELARGGSTRALRRRARRAIARAAGRRGLTPEAFEDRTAPTLGLDPSGARALDLGGRRVMVTLDDSLRPVLRDAAGRPRSRLPAPRVADDPDAHAAARAALRELRRDARRVEAQQRARLERAMVRGRVLSVAELRARFVAHPVVRRLADRLVWIALTPTGPRPFRVAEDDTLADAEDDELVLEPSTRVRLAHPWDLTAEARARWAERLADYGLVQPFEQLGRAVFTLPEAAVVAGRLLDLEGGVVDWRAVDALRRRGFDGRGADGPRVTRFEGEVFDVPVRIRVDPGLHVGSPQGSGRQRVVRADAPLRDLEAVLRSEIRRALSGLAGPIPPGRSS
ncbi:MAG TPA: DUF4132 domain-containing protein, partial [Sandaracinaceae bacterium LLY-WYZ-13_1]|nr:DUF4132 domain-containing protein [Sandaracinaceae bacterium LLY-WYZ-13_1]